MNRRPLARSELVVLVNDTEVIVERKVHKIVTIFAAIACAIVETHCLVELA